MRHIPRMAPWLVGVALLVAATVFGMSPAQIPALAAPAATTLTTPEVDASTGTEPSEPIQPTEEPTSVPSDDSGTEPAPPALSPSPSGSTSATPTPTPSTSTPQPTPSPTGAVLQPAPPALSGTGGQPVSWGIAVAVLLASLAVVFALTRRKRSANALPTEVSPSEAIQPTSDPAAELAALEAVGEAMVDAGYSVTTVRAALTDIAAAHGAPATEIVVFPTALFVSRRGLGEVHTGAVSSGHSRLLLHQMDALDDVVTSARQGEMTPTAIRERIIEIRTMPPPYSPAQRLVAYVLLSAALSVLLGASWAGVMASAVLGAGIGVLLLLTSKVQPQYQALVTVAAAFVVTTAVLLLAAAGLDPGVLPSLIAPLVTFLPGALLTTGVIELSTGQMMSGAGRVAAGAMQLLLLAAGVIAAAALVGVPRLVIEAASQPLGPLAPWLAVAIYGAAVVIYQGGRLRSIGWILLVLYVAYGAQVIGDIFFGGVLSALVGAAAMTPVAALVAAQRSGPAAFVSFLPAFYLLVPGALGLVGITSILDGDLAGLNTLLTTGSTMVAIALGILIGSAATSRLRPIGGALL